MQYKLVPPGNHWRNQAERMIQTTKAHFISILAGVNDKFPLSLWCHLLELTKLTLNLLCQLKVAPKISTNAQVHGPHNYMKNHLHLLAVQFKPKSNWRTAAHGTHNLMQVLALVCQWTSPVFPGEHHKNMGNMDQWHGFLQTCWS